jgi:serine/threonine protein kinase
LYADTWYVQGNILVTREGQACLGDFGIADTFSGLRSDAYKLETLRYMAPERAPEDLYDPEMIEGPSRASDVYSLAMTSFKVCSFVVSHLTI